MIKYLAFLLMSFSALAQNSSPKLDPNKYTICAITINSDDEKKVFQSYAEKFPNKYNPVVELTTMGGPDEWFKNACQSGIKCDQLLISGHFAGEFFSENGAVALSLDELEKAGCSKTCEGILSNPYEVFLFGCNTLAGKETDSRTPAQYLQVLLTDGIPLAQAEMIVQSRYGEVGDSNKASMQRAFAGEIKQLYGFSSVGPLGKNIKGFLEEYFKKQKSADHLDKLSAKRMTNQLMEGNKLLAESLKSTSFAECGSSNIEDEKTKNICGLLDTKNSLDKKLELTVELLASDKALIYLPAINHLFKELDTTTFTDSQKQTFKMISENAVIKSQLLGLISKTDGLGIKTAWLKLATKFTYLSENDKNKILLQEIKKVLAKPVKESDGEAICELSEKAKDLNLTEADIGYKKVTRNEIFTYMCLEVQDIKTHDRVMKVDPKGNKEMVKNLRYYASSVLPNNYKLPQYLVQSMRKDLKSLNDEEVTSAMFDLNKFFPGDAEVVALAKKIIASGKGGDNLKAVAQQILSTIKN